jgi:hypothetical protein
VGNAAVTSGNSTLLTDIFGDLREWQARILSPEKVIRGEVICFF